MNKQPEALRLADDLLFYGRFGYETELDATKRRNRQCADASKELLRLHEVNQKLLEALKEIVGAADGNGWNQLDASFSKARAAIAKAGKTT